MRAARPPLRSFPRRLEVLLAPRAAAEPTIFSLGLISDVQWARADADDGWNYARTTRHLAYAVQLTRAVD